MRSSSVPAALSSRLGHEATEGLVELLDTTKSEAVNEVLSIATERFERRVTEEVAALRVDFIRELHEGLAGVRKDLHDGLADGRKDLDDGLAGVRDDLHQGLAGLRGELHQSLASVRQDFTRELASVRVELIKWSFAFWIAQVAVVGGLLLGLVRYFRVG